MKRREHLTCVLVAFAIYLLHLVRRQMNPTELLERPYEARIGAESTNFTPPRNGCNYAIYQEPILLIAVLGLESSAP
jgi:hypothetical protein